MAIAALLPKEHGAYGQVGFPLVTVLLIGATSAPAQLLVLTVVTLFLAHEPLLIAMGRRGPRVRRELGAPAMSWLAALCTVAAAASAAALRQFSYADWWTLLVPALPAAAVLVAIRRGAEKTGVAEICASCAFAGAAFPVGAAGGVRLIDAAAVSVVFAVNFVLATLAVRALIVRVRGGGDPPAAAGLRRAALVTALVALMAIGIACYGRVFPTTAFIATVPGLGAVTRLTLYPPPVSRLRSVGWMLIGSTVVTSAVIVAGLG